MVMVVFFSFYYYSEPRSREIYDNHISHTERGLNQDHKKMNLHNSSNPEWLWVPRKSGNSNEAIRLPTLDGFDRLENVQLSPVFHQPQSNETLNNEDTELMKGLKCSIAHQLSDAPPMAASATSIRDVVDFSPAPASALSEAVRISVPDDSEAHPKNSVSLEELTPQVIAKVPCDENGDPLSFGSIGHANGTCKGELMIWGACPRLLGQVKVS